MRSNVCLIGLVIVTLSFSQIFNLAFAEPLDQLKRRINLIKVSTTETNVGNAELRAKQEQLISFQNSIDKLVNDVYNGCTKQNAMFIKDSEALAIKSKMRLNITGMLFTLLVDKPYRTKDSANCAKIPDVKLNDLWTRKVTDFQPVFNQAKESLLVATKNAAKKECATDLKSECGFQASQTCALNAIYASIGDELQRCFDIPEDDLKYVGLPVVRPNANTQETSLMSQMPNEGCTSKPSEIQVIEGLNKNVTAISTALIDVPKGIDSPKGYNPKFASQLQLNNNTRENRLQEGSHKSDLEKLEKEEQSLRGKIEYWEKYLNRLENEPKPSRVIIREAKSQIRGLRKELKDIQQQKVASKSGNVGNETKVDFLSNLGEAQQKLRNKRLEEESLKSPQQKREDAVLRKIENLNHQLKFYEDNPKKGSETIIKSFKEDLELSRKELELIRRGSK